MKKSNSLIINDIRYSLKLCDLYKKKIKNILNIIDINIIIIKKLKNTLLNM